MPQPLAAILRAGGLGDTILALPAIASIRASLPDWRIRLIGYPGFAELATLLVDEVLSVDSSRSGWFAGADIVIAWSQHVPATPCRLIQASPYPPPGVHASDWLLATLPPDLRQEVPDPFSVLTGSRTSVQGQTTDAPPNPVVIHPGAGADWKRWPAGKFAEVTETLEKRGIPMLAVQGPADTAVTAEFLSSLRADRTPYVSNLTSHVSALVSLLSTARAYIGNDSGVTHLAAALGVPTVALFGPTDPASWAPRRAHVVRACARTTEGQGEIRVCFDPNCMNAISVEAVLEVLDPVLHAAPI